MIFISFAFSPTGYTVCSILPLFCTLRNLHDPQIKVARGLIAPLTPEDNKNGGHPWIFSGLEQDERLLLKTLTVWVAHDMIKAIELKLSDDWMSISEGRPQDHNEGTYAQWSRSHVNVGRGFSMVFFNLTKPSITQMTFRSFHKCQQARTSSRTDKIYIV